MLSKILSKYTKVEEINSNSNVKTYSARIEPIIKEITPKDINEHYLIKEKLENNRNGIYEIIEENNKIYIIIENNQEIISKIDKLILEKEVIPNEQENLLFGAIPPIGEPNPLMTEEIKGDLKTTQVFTGPIIDQEFLIQTDTNSNFHEATDNKVDENFINSNSQIIYPPDQGLSSFKTQGSPLINPTPEIQTTTVNDQEISAINTYSVGQPNTFNPISSVEPLSINNDFNVENKSIMPQNSNNPMSNNNTPSIGYLSVSHNPKIEETSVSFNMNVQSITSPPVVTAPTALSMAPTVGSPESIIPPSSTPELVTSNGSSSGLHNTSHKKTKSSFIDEDFKRQRPFYEDINRFNDDRYRGFRLGYQLYQ